MDDELTTALLATREGFGLSPERIEPLLGGTTHSCYRVLCAGAPLFLKGYALASLPRAATEAQLLAHLAKSPSAMVRTPVPREAAGGLLHQGNPSAAPGAPCIWLLTNWLPGEKRRWHDFSEDDWRALGAALAALHEALSDVSAPTGMPRLGARLSAIDPAQEQDRLADHAQAVLKRRISPPGARRYFAGRMRLLSAMAARLFTLRTAQHEQALHNDYNQYNFLFSDGHPPAVVDWERACLAPPEYEVVRCINVACLRYPARAAAFLAAYGARRPVDPAALRFATTAFLLEQATKHWPAAAWLEGRDSAGHFEAQFELIELLSSGLAAYDRFYQL